MITDFFPQFEQPVVGKIKSFSDPYLTVALLAAAVFLIWVALTRGPAFKAAVLAWVILP